MNGLQEFLFSAGEEVSTLELCRRWRESVIAIIVRCRRSPGREGVPAWQLADRVRAALGSQLAASASPDSLAGRACPWRPPCAFDLLFRSQGEITARRELPKPFVPAVDYHRTDDSLLVSCSLFGVAADHAPAVAQALVIALRHGLECGGWASGPVEILDCAELEVRPRLMAEAAMTAVMEFTAPVCQRKGRNLHFDPLTLLTGLGERLSGLARWHGLTLSEDWTRIKEICSSLDWDATAMRPVSAEKYSARQGMQMQLEGFLGSLAYRGAALPLLAPLLALGERCHLGKNTTNGLGRYRLAWIEI